MSSTIIGKVKSGSRKDYDVKWDSSSKEVYVNWGGWTRVGKASSASDAMRMAEAWLYNK
jgi:hypothetical protein